MTQAVTVRPGKEWAKKLRVRWLAGDRTLILQQVVMGSSALEERWHEDSGYRECSPVVVDLAA